MPRGNADDFFSNTELARGVVAIFWFPPSEKYPNGTKHVAYVDAIDGENFHIKQSNKITCTETEEWVSINTANLLGFYVPPIDK